MRSSYLAKYFLEVKHFRERSDKDSIFMKPYLHTLKSLVDNSISLSLSKKLTISHHLAKGLSFIGYWGVLHRDLKPANVMVDSSLRPVLIDFGSCAPIIGDTHFKVRK